MKSEITLKVEGLEDIQKAVADIKAHIEALREAAEVIRRNALAVVAACDAVIEGSSVVEVKLK